MLEFYFVSNTLKGNSILYFGILEGLVSSLDLLYSFSFKVFGPRGSFP